MNAIEIRNLTVAYGENIALENLNLDVEAGSLMALVGSNGAGKSTLIKTILKFLKQITGEIKINGKTLAYVPQRNSVDWDFPTTLFDVVEMGCYGRVGLFKRVSKEEKQKVLKAIEQVGMLDFKDRQISELSGGQQQRVGIARALAANPDIILMDEPFGAVDAITRYQLQKDLKELHKKTEATIVFITHDITEALKLGTKVLVLDKGKIQQHDIPKNICSNPKNEFVKQLLKMAEM